MSQAGFRRSRRGWPSSAARGAPPARIQPMATLGQRRSFWSRATRRAVESVPGCSSPVGRGAGSWQRGLGSCFETTTPAAPVAAPVAVAAAAVEAEAARPVVRRVRSCGRRRSCAAGPTRKRNRRPQPPHDSCFCPVCVVRFCSRAGFRELVSRNAHWKSRVMGPFRLVVRDKQLREAKLIGTVVDKAEMDRAAAAAMAIRVRPPALRRVVVEVV